MSIPGISAGMSPAVVGTCVGVGELPDMSIPGMSAGISAAAVCVGELSDMSIPGMSCEAAGVGELAGPTPTGSAAALTGVAANDSRCDVNVSDPTTAAAATSAPTDPTWILRRHRKPPLAGGLLAGGVHVRGRGM
jgi:hypothetical protein